MHFCGTAEAVPFQTQGLDFATNLRDMILARFIREGAESGLWGDQITPNIMAWG